MSLISLLIAFLLCAILALSGFVALIMARAVAAMPDLAKIDPFALRVATKMSTFCFYFFTAVTLFLAGCIPFYAFSLLISG